MPVQLVPLILMFVAAGWFATHPGWGTFIMAVLAFLLWLGIFIAEAAYRKMVQGKRKIERLVGQFKDEAQGIDRGALDQLAGSDDPRYRGLLEVFERSIREPALRVPAQTALKQLGRLPQLFADYRSLLESRLNPGELTLGRYLDSGQRLHDQVLSELKEVSVRLSGARSALSPEEARPQLALISDILNRSDRGLKQLARANGAIAAMRGKEASTLTLEDAIRDMADLADRARKY